MPAFMPRPATCALRIAILFATLLLSFAGDTARAQNTTAAPNTDPAYQALRNGTLSGEAVTVNNFKLKRDAGTFLLRSGTVCFVAPVNGKVTGAVFSGDGDFFLNPPSESEQKFLKLLTKEDEFHESFSQLVLRFTDSTYDDIKKAATFSRVRVRLRSAKADSAHDPARPQVEPGIAHSRRCAES